MPILATLGCANAPRTEANLGPPVPNRRWRLQVEARPHSSSIHVSLTNTSDKQLRAYGLLVPSSLYLVSEPSLPIPVAHAVIFPDSHRIKAGKSLEANLRLGEWFEIKEANSGQYTCRLIYSDDAANNMLDGNQKSQVGKVSSNDFGFTIANGKIEEVWYEDVEYIMMPQDNGFVAWPKSDGATK